jgi:hypothetical protein
LVTTVDATGSDVKLASEQAIREALTALGTADGWIAATGTWTPRSQAYTGDPAAGANIELAMADTSGFEVGDVVKVTSGAGSENALITVVHANTHLTVAALYLNHDTTTPLVKLADTLYVERAYTGDPAAGNNIELAMADTTGFSVGDLVEVSSSAGRENATVTVVHASTHLTVNTLALDHTTVSPMVKQVVQNTFIVDTSGDLSATLSVGMKLKFTDSTVKYGILHAIATTRLTIYTGTDYSIVSTSALSDTFYSMVRVPFGFPMSPAKWTVEVIDNATRTQATPTNNTWYNTGEIKIVVPVGAWNLGYQATASGANGTTATTIYISTTLSTANNSDTDKDFLCGAAGANMITYRLAVSRYKYISALSKTTYYLNIQSAAGSIANIYFLVAKSIIRAVDAYL